MLIAQHLGEVVARVSGAIHYRYEFIPALSGGGIVDSYKSGIVGAGAIGTLLTLVVPAMAFLAAPGGGATPGVSRL